MYINAHNTPMFVCILNVNRGFGSKNIEERNSSNNEYVCVCLRMYAYVCVRSIRIHV